MNWRFDLRAIILLLRDRAARTRAEAIQVLERLKAKRALPYLREMLHDDAWLYASGQVTVADIARRAIRTLRRAAVNAGATRSRPGPLTRPWGVDAPCRTSSFTAERVVPPGRTSGLLELGDQVTFEGRHFGVRGE